jgi:hypothetical protein
MFRFETSVVLERATFRAAEAVEAITRDARVAPRKVNSRILSILLEKLSSRVKRRGLLLGFALFAHS